jgi:hypothetical protein
MLPESPVRQSARQPFPKYLRFQAGSSGTRFALAPEGSRLKSAGKSAELAIYSREGEIRTLGGSKKPTAVFETRAGLDSARGTTPIRADDRRCIERPLLSAGPRGVAAPPGPPIYAVGDHSSGGAAKRAGIGASPWRSAAIVGAA